MNVRARWIWLEHWPIFVGPIREPWPSALSLLVRWETLQENMLLCQKRQVLWIFAYIHQCSDSVKGNRTKPKFFEGHRSYIRISCSMASQHMVHLTSRHIWSVQAARKSYATLELKILRQVDVADSTARPRRYHQLCSGDARAVCRWLPRWWWLWLVVSWTFHHVMDHVKDQGSTISRLSIHSS